MVATWLAKLIWTEFEIMILKSWGQSWFFSLKLDIIDLKKMISLDFPPLSKNRKGLRDEKSSNFISKYNIKYQ